MSLLNIVGIIALVVALTAGIGIKLYTRRKLKELDGLGEINVQGDKAKNIIKL